VWHCARSCRCSWGIQRRRIRGADRVLAARGPARVRGGGRRRDGLAALAVRRALGRLLYLVHLAVLLWWLLDRSARQRATNGLVSLTARSAVGGAGAARAPVRTFVVSIDALMQDALFGARVSE